MLVRVCSYGIYPPNNVIIGDEASWAIHGTGTGARVSMHSLSHCPGGGCGEPPAEMALSREGAQGHRAKRRPATLFDLRGVGTQSPHSPAQGTPAQSLGHLPTCLSVD